MDKKINKLVHDQTNKSDNNIRIYLRVINKTNITKLIMGWMPGERRKRGRPRGTWMEGVRAAMKTRHLEADQWLNRKEWCLGSGRRRQMSQDRKDRYNILQWWARTSDFFLWRCNPTLVMASSFLRFLDHTQRRTTVGRTPLDEWSARRRDFYLTTHNKHNIQTSMPPVGFEPTISGDERAQTHALDRSATGTGSTS